MKLPRLAPALGITAAAALVPISAAGLDLPPPPLPLPPPPALAPLNVPAPPPATTGGGAPTIGGGGPSGALGSASTTSGYAPGSGLPPASSPARAQAIAALLSPAGYEQVLATAPGGDPAPPSARSDDARSPRDGSARGSSAGAAELDRQQYYFTYVMDALADGSPDDLLIAEEHLDGGGGQLAWPESHRTITQGFGCTGLKLAPTSSSCASGHFHTGMDIAGPDRSAVHAAEDGVVHVFSGTTGYGNFAMINHGNGFFTLYGHLRDVTVKEGDVVRRGDEIGHEGSTGNSTGPHLHFEVRKEKAYLDPCLYLEGCKDGRAVEPAPPPAPTAAAEVVSRGHSDRREENAP